MINKLYGIKKLLCNSPMVKINYEYKGIKRNCYAKLEWYSLTGSVKDRVAYNIIFNAYKLGELKRGDKIVEVSSGNMGISICAIANITQNPVTIIMPKAMSEERKKLIKLYGATLVEVDDFKAAFDLCAEYVKNGYFCPKQFENKFNLNVHERITGAEIAAKIKNRRVWYFVSGVGTAGTLCGAGRYLKKHLGLKVLAIQPKNAQILTGEKYPKHHKLQGISDEIVPKLFSEQLVDRYVEVGDNDALKVAQKLCKMLALPVGISSAANFIGCVISENNAVTIFPDDNKKYLSTDLSDLSVSSELADKIKLISVKYI